MEGFRRGLRWAHLRVTSHLARPTNWDMSGGRLWIYPTEPFPFRAGQRLHSARKMSAPPRIRAFGRGNTSLSLARRTRFVAIGRGQPPRVYPTHLCPSPGFGVCHPMWIPTTANENQTLYIGGVLTVVGRGAD
jgi:hypothetical protein